MILKAFAKLNLILKVVGKNIDNYHLLQMLNIKIDLYDEIYIKENKLNNRQIANIVKCDPSVVSNINYGKAYFDSNLTYPLRKS